MIDQDKAYKQIIKILDSNKANYKLFTHKAAFNYEELLMAKKESGFDGTEGKCLVIKTKNSFVVCITIQGKKLNFSKLKEILSDEKIRLASSNELKEHFSAEPGCAYPFGFKSKIKIYIDPIIYNQVWFLFSPVFPTKTIQVNGLDLKKVFNNLDNKIEEKEEIFMGN